MKTFLKRSKFGAIIALAAVILIASATVWAADGRNGLAKVNPAEGPYLQVAEITQLEKMIFDRERGEKKSTSGRMTWEGILASDSPGRSACKQACLDDYGVGATNEKGSLCDDRGWNKCMRLMDWGVVHWHRSCKGDHKEECEACWVRQTQGCYDGAFKRCLDHCPK